jgi:3-deoxy-D-manno-octulosonate 8-phosphate phosphatase (KDO 8-P phosphatase)
MVIFDIDGVLSDGRIIFGSDGTEYKVFDAHDGYGITRGRELGLQFAAISGRNSKVTTMRMERLGVKEVHQNQMDKVKSYRQIAKKHKLKAVEVCFIGDDEFDLPLLRVVGFSAAPRDAMERVVKEVDYVTKRNGGRGAVREVIDLILAAKHLL